MNRRADPRDQGRPDGAAVDRELDRCGRDAAVFLSPDIAALRNWIALEDGGPRASVDIAWRRGYAAAAEDLLVMLDLGVLPTLDDVIGYGTRLVVALSVHIGDEVTAGACGMLEFHRRVCGWAMTRLRRTRLCTCRCSCAVGEPHCVWACGRGVRVPPSEGCPRHGGLDGRAS